METENSFLEACEIGNIKEAKMWLARKDFDPTKLDPMKTEREGRTCLHLAVLGGDQELLQDLVGKLNHDETLCNKQDSRGDTALHLAVWKYRVDMVTLLLHNFKTHNVLLRNNKGETPLCIAVKFGFRDVVEMMICNESEDVKKLCKDVKVLHLAVQLNRFNIVKFLTDERKNIMKELINQRVEAENKNEPRTPINQGVEGSTTKASDKESESGQPAIEGDTPLHIAARNKNEPIVDLLRKVKGVNKHALNEERKTALDVAREVTEYYESFRIIKKLTDYPRNYSKPFMYCAPEVSKEKNEKAMETVRKSFDDRRNIELVVAALLATMTFAAVFTVPGGSYPDSKDLNRGSPILLGYYMFKLFIVFDCIAFFLSLFVCIMWQMASELTTEDKMLFMTLSSLLTCFSFGFSSCSFMAAVHTILAHKDWILAYVILAVLVFIELCGFIAFFHQMALFAVGRARFHRLCGVPRRLDDFVANVWTTAEKSGILTILRNIDHCCHDTLLEGEDPHENDKRSCSCFSSPWLCNAAQSV